MGNNAMLKTRVVFAMTVTLGLGTYASGQDVTEIDECKTIDAPGSYLLEKDLAATGDCLVVTSDFVTIDLGGFTISGDGAEADFEDPGALSLGPFGTGSGISTPSFQKGVTVRNGQITGFNVGIDLGTGGAHVVEGVRVFANSFIGIRAGRASLIKDNLSLFNGYEGEFTIEGSAGIVFISTAPLWSLGM